MSGDCFETCGGHTDDRANNRVVRTDLTTFLHARLDEDERLARAASFDGSNWRYEDRDEHPQRWTIFGANWSIASMWAYGLDAAGRPRYTNPDSEAAHIIRWHPARVLADVAAKRAIVELHAPGEDGRCTTCIEHCGDSLYPTEYAESPCHELRLLAQPYADHEDFDPAWSE